MTTSLFYDAPAAAGTSIFLLVTDAGHDTVLGKLMSETWQHQCRFRFRLLLPCTKEPCAEPIL
jgi:hypothetical protein